MANLLVEVAVNSAPVYAGSNTGTLTYTVPPELASRVKEGSLVLVPVGKRLVTGVVVALPDTTDRSGLKDISALLEGDFLPPGMIELGRYLAGRYLYPLAVAITALLPPATGRRLERRWCWLPAAGGETEEALKLASCLPVPAGAVAAYLAGRRVAGEDRLRQFGHRQELIKVLTALKSHGLIREEWSWRGSPHERQTRWVIPGEGAAARIEFLVKKAPRQAAILKSLLDGGPRPVAGLAASGGYTALKRLEEQGLIKITPLPPAVHKGTGSQIKLNSAQEKAAGCINAALGRGGTFLLHGVTGSGKTEVYLHCAAEALARGYQVLFLVPEHSLIPQMVTRVKERLGEEAAVVHGELAAGERATVWEQARRGEARVITGTRSALFTPMPRLGLIVVDEEHAGSYKQDAAPRYDAREVAIKRGQLEGAVVVLGSATPSTEIFYLARQGKIKLLELPRRPGNVNLPRVEIVDLRAEFRAGHQGVLSRRLEQGISGALAAGRQVILFLNRRGYAHYILCRHCGHVPLCRHCAVALTYHRDGTLRCHYCGYIEKGGTRCPVCGGNLVRLGSGTQRVEEEARALWPGARILRADGDTTARKGRWEEIYHTFADGQADILVGTQTITKGMDFPGVALVGVVNADLSLYQPDFRARERTFQLLTQVAGRAGRRAVAGEVIIQTYNPHDPAITLAAIQDYNKFYEQEIGMRHRLCYPPFIKLVRLGFTGPDEAGVIETAHEVAGLINSKGSKIQVLGPAPGYPSRVKDHYRWQLILKVPGWSRYKHHLAETLAAYRNRHNVRMIVDVGPINPW
ncbi:replication restart helicase PriA [Moorella sulfitireducens]|uniref:replication restart helicase PriA n=1 Tax=Neomoorella sulfitireducens TaxID=2972948 RepID=UPI0021ABA3D5|nr:primosomal protein N' [Moorella sulfitireducens]